MANKTYAIAKAPLYLRTNEGLKEHPVGAEVTMPESAAAKLVAAGKLRDVKAAEPSRIEIAEEARKEARRERDAKRREAAKADAKG